MMLHQDGSTHQWVPGQLWDLIVTLGDATSEHYSMFFVEHEGTASSLVLVLVFEIVVEKKQSYCLLEIERRQNPDHSDKERFSGLIFPLPAPGELERILPSVLASLPAVRGVFKNIKSLPEGSEVFRHIHAKNQSMVAEAAIHNAFGKVGILPPRAVDRQRNDRTAA